MALHAIPGAGHERRERAPRADDVTTAVLALRARPAAAMGPALGRVPFPLLTIVLSAGLHAAGLLGLVMAMLAMAPEPSKTYVVNLVPAIAAVGSPTGRAETPRRPEEPPPRATPPAPPSPPKSVETPRPAPPRPAPELPAREVPVRPSPPPELPARDLPRPRADLPERSAALRPPSLPKPGERELPPVASAPPPARPAPPLPARAAPPLPAVPREAVKPAPAASVPQGRPSGSAAGSGALTVNVADFPYAWYLRVVERKIHESWRQPLHSRETEALAVFEIGRDGQVHRVQIERTSGDLLYDQAALRAVQEANPFPPLPEDYKQPWLRVHMAFTYSG